jgi:hypothetical protein
MLWSQVIGALSAPWWAVGAYNMYITGAEVPSKALPALAAYTW